MLKKNNDHFTASRPNDPNFGNQGTTQLNYGHIWAHSVELRSIEFFVYAVQHFGRSGAQSLLHQMKQCTMPFDYALHQLIFQEYF